MRNLIHLLVLGMLGLTSTLAHAATLESPAPGANVSGLGYIAGWKCHHGEVTVRIDGGGPIRMATRMPRADTQSVCQGATDNGFITQFNWAFLADGSHTVVAYDNGVEFARSTFTVATFGEEFVEEAQGECTIADFPSTGETARFVWDESTQHLELSEDLVIEHGDTRGTATRLDTILSDASSTSRTQRGGLEEGGDIDYFRLALHRAGTIVVETTGSVDTVGELEDDAGQRLTSDDNGGSGRNFRISRALSAGVYYIKVRGANSATTGAYTLRVTFTPPPSSAPDLVVEQTRVNGSSGPVRVDAEEFITLSATVRNQGQGRSGGTRLRYRYRKDARQHPGTEIGSDGVAARNAGQTSSASERVRAPSVAGTYYYWACVDEVADESNTGNNCSPAEDTVQVVVRGPTQGLVAYYPFDGNARDASGNGHHGSVRGAVPTADRHGNTAGAYAFDGRDDVVVVPNGPDFNDQPAFTLSLWAALNDPYSESFGGNGVTGLLAKGANFDYQYGLGAGNREPRHDLFAVAWQSAGGGVTNAVGDLNLVRDGAWRSIVGVVSAEVSKLYVDGTLIATSEASTGRRWNTSGNADVTIGGIIQQGGTGFFSGKIDEVRIYNRALSDAEVAALAGEVIPPKTQPDLVVERTRGLVEGTPLDGAASQVTVSQGQDIILLATVRNRGQGQSAATTARFRYRRGARAHPGTQVDTSGVYALDSGGTRDVFASIPAPSTAGTYSYWVCVDEVAGESNTGNNCSPAEDTVTVVVR